MSLNQKKNFVLVSLTLSLSVAQAFADNTCIPTEHGCVPPASIAPAPAGGPTVYNRQYCYGANCYPGAYVPGAIDKDGNLPASASDTAPPSAADRLKQELAQAGVEAFTSSNYKPGTVRHIVLFRYDANVTTEQKNEVKQRFLALQRLCKRNGERYVLSIETGGEISGEGADQGLEQGFIVTFKSQGDRNYYVGQPVVTDPSHYDSAHQAFKDFVGPLLDQNGALVFDFAL